MWRALPKQEMWQAMQNHPEETMPPCVCVLPFFLPVDIQHNQRPCRFFNPRKDTMIPQHINRVIIKYLVVKTGGNNRQTEARHHPGSRSYGMYG